MIELDKTINTDNNTLKTCKEMTETDEIPGTEDIYAGPDGTQETTVLRISYDYSAGYFS